jgi:hypothetical protein
MGWRRSQGSAPSCGRAHEQTTFPRVVASGALLTRRPDQEDREATERYSPEVSVSSRIVVVG